MSGIGYGYTSFPIYSSMRDIDVWTLALFTRMKNDSLTVDHIPPTLFGVRTKISDLEWLFEHDLNDYPFGINPRKYAVLDPVLCQEITLEIYKYIEHFEVLVEDLLEHYLHFASECIGISRNIFPTTFNLWYNQYFENTPSSNWGQALRTYSWANMFPEYVTQRGAHESDPMVLVYFLLWHQMKPSLPYIELWNITHSWINTTRNNMTIYEGEQELDDDFFMPHFIG